MALLGVPPCANAVSSPQESSAAAAGAWAGVPQILARIRPPKFPPREFVITRFGAKDDGVTDCTQAFADAIEACTAAGGGKVVVPPGTFLTGPIHLKSNVNLHAVKGATVKFFTDPAKYLPLVLTRFEGTEVMNYSPLIYARGQENIAITGEGTFDGQADESNWHGWKGSGADIKTLVQMGEDGVPVSQRIFGPGHKLRPNFVQPSRCHNVLIEGVTFRNSPMWVLHPLYSVNVIVRGVTVVSRGPNTDGCDPESCTDVWIKDCSFSDGDDCIAIKAGRDADGRRVNAPCQNLVIQDCVFKDGHGGVTCGSETAGGIANVFAENCQFDSPNLDMALRFKTGMTRGGYIKNVFIRNCTAKTAKVGIHLTMRYSGTTAGTATPALNHIDIRDCTFEKLLKQPVVVEGFSDTVRITDVTIANCVFQNAPGLSLVTNASRVFVNGGRGSGLAEVAAP